MNWPTLLEGAILYYLLKEAIALMLIIAAYLLKE